MQTKLLVTDTEYNFSNLKYIEFCTTDTVERLGGKLSLKKNDMRSELFATIDGATLKFLIPSIEDKVADVIAINYKYSYFKSHIKTNGLDELEFELLLCSLISADLDEDKRYIRSKIKKSDSFAIDGAFNFMMKPLKDKWQEVASYIPSIFLHSELRDFVAYLIMGKGGRRVFVDSGKVYDRHFNRLSRTMLTSKSREANILREVILSAAGEVELSSKLPEIDEFYLKEFFGDKIFFGKSYFT